MFKTAFICVNVCLKEIIIKFICFVFFKHYIIIVIFTSLAPNSEYLPVLYIDQLGVVYRYLKVILPWLFSQMNKTEWKKKII